MIRIEEALFTYKEDNHVKKLYIKHHSRGSGMLMIQLVNAYFWKKKMRNGGIAQGQSIQYFRKWRHFQLMYIYIDSAVYNNF